jgi:AMMECR1 domain-containing protein
MSENVIFLHTYSDNLLYLVQAGGPENFIFGRHVIVLKKGAKQAVFLIQVATEHDWDREQPLTQLALSVIKLL